MKQLLLCFLLYIILSCIGCQKDYYAYDIELWRNTEVWDFAKCISTKRFVGAKVPDPIAPARRPACRGGLLY